MVVYSNLLSSSFMLDILYKRILSHEIKLESFFKIYFLSQKNQHSKLWEVLQQKKCSVAVLL
jgi:hypothetical protein